MSKFLFVYHGGSTPGSEEEQKAVMDAWMSWFGSMGAAVVDGGNPVGQSYTVKPGGKVAKDGGSNPVSGYSVVEAKDYDDAVAKAKACPILDAGGSVEVAEVHEM